MYTILLHLLVAGVFLQTAFAAAIQPPRLFQVLSRSEDIGETYDYVIVGGGTSGLTVGDRLSEDGKYTVLVVEYGVIDDSPVILYGRAGAAMDPSRQFDIPSVPQPELNNRSITVTVGKVVGGSSAINGLQFFRGTSDEYDMWAEVGEENSTWNWAGLLPYFKKSVHFVPPLEDLAKEFNITYDIDAAWGQNPSNNLYAGYPNNQPPQIKLMYDAMKHMPNVEFPRDGNAGTNGVFWYPSQMDPRNYSRSYARTAHWDDISRSNYDLITGSKVTEILFDGDAASGVTFVPVNGSQITTVKARKEVILAAGTIHTPQILQLSGIGPASLLEKANIAVKVNLPGVGANFQDHGYTYGMNYQWTTEPPVPETTSGGNASTMLTYNLGAFLGLPAISPGHVEAIAASYENQDPSTYLPADTHPDILAVLWQIITGDPNANPVFQHPVSRGSINIDPLNPTGEPVVDYRAFSNPFDIDIMVLLMKFVRRYFGSEFFAPYGPIETSPGLNITTDEEIKALLRERYIPNVYHPVGTASLMRRDLGGVVGEDLLVYGVTGLSVVDASVIPIIPGCPTTLTVYAVAEKVREFFDFDDTSADLKQAADMIKARR